MRIFVYGTLRKGGPAEDLLRGCRWLGPAEVMGTLYDVEGRFAALVLEGDSSVRGEVWSGPEDVLERLDRYEGVEDGLYRRTAVEIDGESCWAYVAGPALVPRLRRSAVVERGEWKGARS